MIGTAISAFIVGGGIYFLGQVRRLYGRRAAVNQHVYEMCFCFSQADVIYKMTMTDRYVLIALRA